MIKPNLKYVGFDDRKLFYIGVPVVSFILPILFWNVDLKIYFSNQPLELLETMNYTIVYWLLCRQVSINLRKKYGTLEDMKKRIWLQILIIVPLVPVIGFVLESIHQYIYGICDANDACNPTPLQAILSTYALCFICLLLYDSTYFFYKYKDALEEKNQLELAHVQGQLDNLRNQINPHFLFNSLNTLMNLIPVDHERAMSYLDKLSKFYRYAVSKQKQTLTPLQSELEIARVYADLLHERFQDAIKINLPSHANYPAQILPLSLQLLIENAVKHNIVSKKRPLTISVEVDHKGEYLWVKNNIQKKIQEVRSTGMGLKNIKKRFSFFTDASVQILEENQQFSVGLPFIKTREEVTTETMPQNATIPQLNNSTVI